MDYYFAYGSNMNVERMRSRQLQVLAACAGILTGYGLRFNKRSRLDPLLACANIVYAPQERVEGVLYQLKSPAEIAKLDPYEGTPFRYSRELFWVAANYTGIDETALHPAWVYVANSAVIAPSILPARWYVEHLLAGRAYMTEDYWNNIDQTPCRNENSAESGEGCVIWK